MWNLDNPVTLMRWVVGLVIMFAAVIIIAGVKRANMTKAAAMVGIVLLGVFVLSMATPGTPEAIGAAIRNLFGVPGGGIGGANGTGGEG